MLQLFRRLSLSDVMPLTSRERLLCAMHLGTPDRVPVAPSEFGCLDPDSSIAQELIERTDFIHYVGYGGNPYLGAAAQVDARTEGNKTIVTYQTPSGPLQSVITRTGVTAACTEFPCKSYADAEKILAIPYEPPEADATDYHHWDEKIGEQGIVLVGIVDGICWAADLFSPQDFCLMWMEARDLMIELTEIATQRLCHFYSQLCEAGVELFRIIGGEYVSVQLGPEAYQCLVVEPDRRLVDVIHQHGGIAYFHNHGPITRYYDQLLQIGPDAVDPLEAPPWGDCDIAEAKDRIGSKICLVGNLDDMEVLGKYPTEKVLAMGRELIEKAGPGGFILAGTASGTYTEYAARNFLALAELSRQMAG